MDAQAFVPFTAAIIIAVALLALLLAIAALAHSLRLKRQLLQQLKTLERELALLQSGALGMGQRILAMEAQKNTRLDTSGGDTNLKPYAEATHLLALGVDRDEVANRCGLSRAETSLLDALRAKAQQ